MLICSSCGSEGVHKNGHRDGKQRYKCSNCRSEAKPLDSEDYSDMAKENVRLAKRAQKFQDKNRIANTTFRNNAKAENAVIEYVDELRRVIEENKVDFSTINLPKVTPQSEAGSVGIIHLSDLHFNELVDIIGNKYDFNVASQRLVLFAEKILSSIRDKGITQLYVVFTGDLLNSDRRTDELLAMATNRAMATFLAIRILSQFIVHIACISKLPIKVISVTGNESRIRDEYTQLDMMATDNFDFMIYEGMRMLLSEGSPSIEFVSGETFEYILEIHGKSILIVHGHRLGKMTHNDLSKAISKWAKKGVLITAIMCGHLHEANITDTLLRNGSLVGNNAYADAGLNLHSHASQNFYIVNPDGTIDATKFDLQFVDEHSPAYDIDSDLEAYNAKSVGKIKDKRIIIERIT